MKKIVFYSALLLLLTITMGIFFQWKSPQINSYPIPKGLKIVRDNSTPDIFYISYDTINNEPLKFKIVSKTNNTQDLSLLAEMVLTSCKLINVKSSQISIKNGKNTQVYKHQWDNYSTNKYVYLFYEKTEVTSDAFQDFFLKNLKEDSQVTIIFKGDTSTIYEYLDDTDIQKILRIIKYYQVLTE